ncbi:MAG: RNA polymerase sigma factor [Hyphomicrobiaceae bacterium]
MSDPKTHLIAVLPRLRRFCRGLAGSAVDGDELLQMACERALSRLHQWQPGTRFDSWMYRIAQTIWINKMQQEKTRNTVSDTDALSTIVGGDSRHELEVRDIYGKTMASLRRLPVEQREVLILVCVEGLSYKEAADMLELKIGTVMSRLARARMRLREMVHGEHPAPRTEKEEPIR